MTLPASVVSAVRTGVRRVLEETPALRDDPQLQEGLATRMLGVSMAAAELLAEDERLSEEIAAKQDRAPALATAQVAADMRSGRAVQSAAGVLRSTREAIDFPGFVTNLITGVFQSIQTSNIQQLQAFSELMEAVDSSTEDFSASSIGRGRAAQWAVDRFGVFTMEADGDELNLALKEDSEMPDSETLMRVLDASDEEVSTVDEYELGETLIPLVQRKLGRDRQSMLATMIKMGLQRVVVDDGQLHASMRLQVDARSVAEQTQGEQFDSRVETEASASFGIGNWGASAKMSASVGYVTSDEQYSREDIAVQAGLRSSVDLRFRTLPLDVRQVADDRQLETVQSRSLNPDAPGEYSSLIGQNPPRVTSAPARPTPAAPGSLIAQDRGTTEQARAAREAALQREREQQAREDSNSDANTSERNTGTTERTADTATNAEGAAAETTTPATETTTPATETTTPATETTTPATETATTADTNADASGGTEGTGARAPAEPEGTTEGADEPEGGATTATAEPASLGGGALARSHEEIPPERAPSVAALGGQWSTPGRLLAHAPTYPVIPRS